MPNFVISYERSVPWNYSANLSNSSQHSIFMLPANPKSYLSSDCELKCKIDGSEYNVCHRVLYPWIKKCLKWFWFCWQPVLILYFATNQTRPESSGEAVRATHSSEHPQSQAISFTIFILSSVNYFFFYYPPFFKHPPVTGKKLLTIICWLSVMEFFIVFQWCFHLTFWSWLSSCLISGSS